MELKLISIGDLELAKRVLEASSTSMSIAILNNAWSKRQEETRQVGLLLIHGTADQRVPFSESQIMYDKLIQLGMKDRVSLVPLDGAGHSFSRNPDKVKVYRHKFSFLERLP